MSKKLTVAIVICIAIVSIVTLGACDKIMIDEIANIKYDGVSITWDKIDNVTGYNIKISSADGTLITEKQPIANAFPFNAMGKAFKVEVSGIAEGAQVKKPKVTEAQFQPLATIDLAAITIGNAGELSWTAVAGANAYLVRVNGGEPITVNTNSYNGLLAGSNSVEIKPVASGDASYFSFFSAAKSVGILDAPTNIDYDKATITWSGGGSGFEVYVNDQLLPASNVSGNSASYVSDGTNFTVKVRAIGDHSITFDSKDSEPKKFIHLAAATNVKFDKGSLIWDSVNGATGYQLKINGSIQSAILDTNTYDNFRAETNYAVEILPVTNLGKGIATWSATYNFRILAAPSVRWQEQSEVTEGRPANCIVWDAVNGAEGYTVFVTDPQGNKSTAERGKNEVDFAESFLITGGRYTINVVANGAANNVNIVASKPSKDINVIRLEAPKENATNFITSDPNVLSGFTINYLSVPDAKGYQLYRTDTPTPTSSTSNLQIKVPTPVEPTVTVETILNYFVKSVGGVTTLNGVTTARLNSVEKLSFDIKILATPSALDIDGYNLTWGAVGVGNKYAISGIGVNTNSETNTYNLEGLQAGDYSPSVATKGDGKKVLTSNSTAPIGLTRLQTPRNIHIGFEDAEEGKLMYDAVPFARAYMAYFGGIGGEPTNVSSHDNIAAKITTAGTQVHVYADANCWDSVDKKVYYLSSRTSETVTFTKLGTPTFAATGAFTNTDLTWSHAHNSDYAPSYKVYNGEMLCNGQITGTSVDISNAPAGDISYKVKAIGDGMRYINSDMSEVKSINKLAKPTIVRVAGAYTWKSVVGASKYQLTIDDVVQADETHVANKTYSCVPTLFKELRPYTVKLVAIGDNGVTTIDSDAFTLTQEIKQLNKPTFKVSYNKPAYAEDGRIKLDITDTPQFATGYIYNVAGAASGIVAATTYDMCPAKTGEFKTSVVAVGGFDTVTGDYYLNSNVTATQTINLLAVSSVSSIDLSMDGKVTWGASPSAVSYKLEYKIGSAGAWVTATAYSGTSSEIPEFGSISKPTSITVRVTAIGNGSTIITSMSVEKTIQLR